MSSPDTGPAADKAYDAGKASPSPRLVQAQTIAAVPRLPRTYVIAWVFAALLSGAYMTGMALRGDGEIAVADAANQVSSGRLIELAEARALKLKVTLEDFQRDVAALRVEVAAPPSNAGLFARLTALEERLSIETGMAVAKIEAAVENEPALANTGVVQAPDPVVASAGAKAPATRVAGVAIVAGPDGQPRIAPQIETGSLQRAPGRADIAAAAQSVVPSTPAGGQALAPNAPPVAPAPVTSNQPGAPRAVAPAVVLNAQTNRVPAAAVSPVVVAADAPAPQPPPRPFAVLLGPGGSVESLRLSWSVLSEQHADTLRSLQPRAARISNQAGAPPVFDLMAGPFRTAADAKRACKTLASRGVDCKVGNFGGDAL